MAETTLSRTTLLAEASKDLYRVMVTLNIDKTYCAGCGIDHHDDHDEFHWYNQLEQVQAKLDKIQKEMKRHKKETGQTLRPLHCRKCGIPLPKHAIDNCCMSCRKIEKGP